MSSPPPQPPPPQQPSPSPPPPSSPRATTAILAVPAPPPPSDPPPPPRKFPAPCWTHEETLALISSYQDKWYSLRRRNLRTADWDAVAEEVTRRCPGQSPAKTSAQCRHKMEKLRKRYRTEKQRISSLQSSSNFGINHNNNRFFGSSWVLFDLIHSMELGSANNDINLQINNNNLNNNNINNNDVGQVDLEVKPFSMHNLNNVVVVDGNNGGNNNSSKKGGDLGNYFDEILLGMNNNNKGKSQNHEFDVRSSVAVQPVKFRVKNHQISRHDYGGASGGGYDDEFDEGDEYVGGGGGGGGGVRGMMPPPGGMKRKSESYGKYDEMYTSKLVSGMNGSASRKEYEGGGSRGGRETTTGVGEMVASIKMLGEGLVKMEKMKIEMMRDIEKMRMEMEMRRSQMILESQQLIVNAFVEGLKKSKKFKPSEID